MAQRKAAEALVIDTVRQIEGGELNAEMYKGLFAGWSDEEFGRWIDELDQGKTFISIIVPNAGPFTLSTERSMKVGESLGVKYFQRLELTDPLTGETYKTPLEYLVIDVPVRRQNQHLVKGRSMPENDKVVDALTGQVTGDSKGGRVSLPELLALESRGLEETILELIKVRGGDDRALRAMRDAIRETGGFSVEAIKALRTKPQATHVLRALLLSVHIDNTIGKQ